MTGSDPKLSLTQSPDWYTLGVQQTLEALATSATHGLTSAEVKNRRQRYGANEIQEAAGRNSWQILLDQFKNVMLLMLIAVAIVSGALDVFRLRSGGLEPGAVPFKDTIAIFAIVILNGLLGYIW